MSDFLENLQRQLQHDEGRIPREGPLHVAYRDTRRIWTTGYGFNLQDRNAAKELAAVTEKSVDKIIAHKEFLTDEEALKLLDNRIGVALSDSRRLIPDFDKLDDPRKLVVASMAFQLGYPTLSTFKSTLEAIQNGNFKDAANHMLNSKWARQAPSRAQALASAIETGQYPKFPPRRDRPKQNFRDRGRARLIPKENRTRMIRDGRDLSRQRDLLKEWTRLISKVPYETIALAEYWWNVYQNTAAYIKEEQRRQELLALSQRMDALQKKTNELYLKYQQTLREMIDAQNELATWQTITSIVGIVKGGISSAELVSGDGKPGSEAGKPETPSAGRISWVVERSVTLGEFSERQRIEVNGEFKDIRDLQQQIHDHYRTLGVPLGIVPDPPKDVPITWPPRPRG